jgi:hypothetical protein
MATITGLTAERMLEIEAASVVDGDVSGDSLFLTRKDGSLINAGNVRGPVGPAGPMGSALSVVSGLVVPDVGVSNQIRAGRQLNLSDFTALGLSAPIGLWNLSNFNDSSGNGRSLVNKGSVPLGVGINGIASTSAVFAGSTGQALYIVDTGAADPFRIRTGTWGCWFRTAKKATNQIPLAKYGIAAQSAWGMLVTSNGNLQAFYSSSGSDQVQVQGISLCDDDRWHFGVCVQDGSRLKVYVDGSLEGYITIGTLIFAGSSPMNIGADAADSVTAGILPFFGRVDEAFVTSDILSDDQVRNLYCASIPHALGSVPKSVQLAIQRRRRGATLQTTDFPSQPSRLYNFTGGALTDQGSNGVPLALTNTPIQIPVAGADGAAQNAYLFVNTTAHTGLQGTDAGLPSALTPRSYGAWFKTAGTAAAGCVILGYGTVGTNDVRLYINSTGGIVSANGGDVLTGSYVLDGTWHHICVVEDSAAADGVKRKVYLDGKVIIGSTGMISITLAGANRFRIGAGPDGSSPYMGTIDGAFVYAGALTSEQVRSLYNVSSQALASSPKDASDHIETMESGRLLGIFDSIETNESIDLAVAA